MEVFSHIFFFLKTVLKYSHGERSNNEFQQKKKQQVTVTWHANLTINKFSDNVTQFLGQRNSAKGLVYELKKKTKQNNERKSCKITTTKTKKTNKCTIAKIFEIITNKNDSKKSMKIHFNFSNYFIIIDVQWNDYHGTMTSCTHVRYWWKSCNAFMFAVEVFRNIVAQFGARIFRTSIDVSLSLLRNN